MTEEEKRYITRKGQLGRHLAGLMALLQADLDAVSEKADQMDTFVHLEEPFLKLEALFLNLSSQLDLTVRASELTQVAARISFVEDRLDELEARLYNRPRRKRRRFSFFNFFKASQNGASSTPSAPGGEITSLTHAYHTLGLEEGAAMSEVTASFRRYVKACHPDVRGGDRSAEAQLRKIIEAYQMLKQHLDGR
jgi:hypothetical protein